MWEAEGTEEEVSFCFLASSGPKWEISAPTALPGAIVTL